ncbi:hypothetical protein OFN43_29675, partial [Escherichia coli]|nr:hypothetical protein [Escherichia coli]
YGKTAAPHPFSALLVMPYAFALIRVQATPAAVERQERSDRVSEEAEFLRCDIRISTHEYYIYFNKLKLTRDKFMVLKIEIHKASNIFLMILC